MVPYTLAENAGLNPINIVTELRKLHANGDKYAGINVKKVGRRALQCRLSSGCGAAMWDACAEPRDRERA